MRSRSSDTEGSALKQFPRHSKDHSFQAPEDMKQKQQDKDTTSESNTILLHSTSHSGNGHQGKDLSRDDLLFLLSILEGELQVSWFWIKPLLLQREGCLWMWCVYINIYIYGPYLSVHESVSTHTILFCQLEGQLITSKRAVVWHANGMHVMKVHILCPCCAQALVHRHV